jgi:hypothetical protein
MSPTIDRGDSRRGRGDAPAHGPAGTAPPTISGTPQQGQMLTADAGSWTGAPSGFAYVLEPVT